MHNLFNPLIKIYKALFLFAYDITGNYGLALILLSFFTFVVLYPFNKKAQHIQSKEHKIQAMLAPQIAAIKRQFSGREQYENLHWLYQRYGYHPLYAIRSALGFVLQIPFLTAAYYMLSELAEIQGVSWGFIPNLGAPDHLLGGINVLPFVMTLVTVVYAFVMPDISEKERRQTIGIGVFFLLLLYSAPSALLIFWTCNLIWSLLDSLLSKKLEWVEDLIEENELAFHVIFALSLTVGLFVPLEVYIKNASQLWFSFQDILQYFLADTAKYFIILLITYITCWLIKFRIVCVSIFLGVLFGLFLQSYIISIDYGLFDGHEIEWEKYTKIGLVNTFIWLVCVVAPFLLFQRFNFNENKIKRFIKPVIFGIIAVQCIALLFTLKNNPLPENAFQSKDSINVLTTKDIFTISSKENIIVFVLDAFDAKLFEEIMVKDPDIINEFSGFVFFPDTVSVYGYTDYSVPQILTGKIYLNDKPYAEYFEEAWKETAYYNILLEKNYDIGIYTAGNLVSKNAPISNLINEKTVMNDASMQELKNLVKFRMTPHYAKKRFYEYDPNAWTRMLANKNLQVYQEDDRKFYNDLRKGLTYKTDKNCFRFYHLAGVHFPFILDRNLEPLDTSTKGSQYEQSVGVIKIVLNYIQQMKEKGVYNNSTIVLMADHGDHNRVGSRPLLCVKQPNVNYSMKVSNVSMSFADFMPLLIQKFQNIEDSKHAPLRFFYYVTKQDDFIEYKIEGNAKYVNSWKENNVLKDYRGQDSSYVLGKTVDFTINGDSKRFKKNGWDRAELLVTWTVCKNAELAFIIEYYILHNLKLSFVAFAYLADLPSRKVRLYANNQQIIELVFDNKNPNVNAIIPSSVMSGEILNLHFTIEHSGVSVKYENRDLGLFVQQMKIEIAE